MTKKISLITLGGTISSEPADNNTGGVVPVLGATLFAQEVARWLPEVEIVPLEFRLLPSPSLILEDILALHRAIVALPGDIEGVVVAQGTDTLEDTAFVLDLLGSAARVPVVVTGAMRDASAAGADGMANLVSAVIVAASAGAHQLGVTVQFADTLHPARWVRKRSTFQVDAFSSDPAGPIGYVSEGRLHITAVPPSRPHLADPGDAILPPVAVLGAGIGDELQLLSELTWQGYGGVIIEGMGGGHVAPGAMENIRTAAKSVPVVICSRTGAGPVLSDTYGYPGGDIDLARSGVLSAETLSATKARLLLTLLLVSDDGGLGIQETFRRYAR